MSSSRKSHKSSITKNVYYNTYSIDNAGQAASWYYKLKRRIGIAPFSTKTEQFLDASTDSGMSRDLMIALIEQIGGEHQLKKMAECLSLQSINRTNYVDDIGFAQESDVREFFCKNGDNLIATFSRIATINKVPHLCDWIEQKWENNSLNRTEIENALIELRKENKHLSNNATLVATWLCCNASVFACAQYSYFIKKDAST